VEHALVGVAVRIRLHATAVVRLFAPRYDDGARTKRSAIALRKQIMRRRRIDEHCRCKERVENRRAKRRAFTGKRNVDAGSKDLTKLRSLV
jgi:hypothetical protein